MKTKKWLSFLLTLVMVLGLLPAVALAEDTGYKFAVTSNLEFGDDVNSTTNPCLVFKSNGVALTEAFTIDSSRTARTWP